jgi:hypothetical protein
MTKIIENQNRWSVIDRTPNPHQAIHCLICGKPVIKPQWQIRVHDGGGTAVTETEAEILNQLGHSDADLGSWPIGTDCLKNHPELEPYAVWFPGILNEVSQ